MTTFITDVDAVNVEGFAPPLFNGSLAVKYASVAHTDTTAKTLFSLPLGAVIVAVVVNVTTAFDSSGTDLLDIGLGGTTNALANDLNVASAGQIVTGMATAAILAAPLTANTNVTATYIPGVADATEGAATVAVVYAVF